MLMETLGTPCRERERRLNTFTPSAYASVIMPCRTDLIKCGGQFGRDEEISKAVQGRHMIRNAALVVSSGRCARCQWVAFSLIRGKNDGGRDAGTTGCSRDKRKNCTSAPRGPSWAGFTCTCMTMDQGTSLSLYITAPPIHPPDDSIRHDGATLPRPLADGVGSWAPCPALNAVRS